MILVKNWRSISDSSQRRKQRLITSAML